LINSTNRKRFPKNTIKTSKYNIINFIPKCIFIQFTRLVNFYFLISAVIMSIKIISPLDPMTAIFPLIFVLFVSLVREAIDELVFLLINYYRKGRSTITSRTRKWSKKWTVIVILGLVKPWIWWSVILLGFPKMNNSLLILLSIKLVKNKAFLTSKLLISMAKETLNLSSVCSKSNSRSLQTGFRVLRDICSMRIRTHFYTSSKGYSVWNKDSNWKMIRKITSS